MSGESVLQVAINKLKTEYEEKIASLSSDNVAEIHRVRCEYERQLESLRVEFEGFKRRFKTEKTANAELIAEYEAKLERIQAELDSANSAHSETKLREADVSIRVEQLTTKMEQLSASKKEADDIAVDLGTKLGESQAKLGEVEQEKSLLEKQLAQSSAQLRAQLDGNESVLAQVTKLMEEKKQLQDDNNTLAKDRARLQQEKKDTLSLLEQARADHSKLDGLHQELKSAYTQLGELNDQLQKDLGIFKSGNDDAVQTAASRSQNYANTLTSLRKQLEDTQKERDNALEQAAQHAEILKKAELLHIQLAKDRQQLEGKIRNKIKRELEKDYNKKFADLESKISRMEGSTTPVVATGAATPVAIQEEVQEEITLIPAPRSRSSSPAPSSAMIAELKKRMPATIDPSAAEEEVVVEESPKPKLLARLKKPVSRASSPSRSRSDSSPSRQASQSPARKRSESPAPEAKKVYHEDTATLTTELVENNMINVVYKSITKVEYLAEVLATKVLRGKQGGPCYRCDDVSNKKFSYCRAGKWVKDSKGKYLATVLYNQLVVACLRLLNAEKNSENPDDGKIGNINSAITTFQNVKNHKDRTYHTRLLDHLAGRLGYVTEVNSAQAVSPVSSAGEEEDDSSVEEDTPID